MEKVPKNILHQFEKREKRGFKDLHSFLSKLPMPSPGAESTLTVAEGLRLDLNRISYLILDIFRDISGGQ